MIDAPMRPVRRSISSFALDKIESPRAITGKPSAIPNQVLDYVLNQTSLILFERPNSGGVDFIHRLLETSNKRVLVVVDDPLSTIVAIQPSQLICEHDERYRFSKLVAEAMRYLKSQLSSAQAELEADSLNDNARIKLRLRIEEHQNQAETQQVRAKQNVLNSASWLKNVESHQQLQHLKSQVESLRAQLTQPTGFFKRLMGRGSSLELQQQLSVVEADLDQTASEAKSESELFRSLLATELEQIREKDRCYGHELQAELDALPLPKFSESERNHKQRELEEQHRQLATAAEEFVWKTRRVLIATLGELAELHVAGRFDKWILDVAKPTADLLRQCNLLAPSGIFLGDVPTLRPPGYRNGTLPHEPSIFDQTWNEQCMDGWAFEGTRLLAQVVPLSSTHRAELKVEPIIGSEQHEVRLLDNGTELILAEVAFAPETTLSAATHLLIEQSELPCLTTFSTPTWTQTEGKLTATWLPANADTCTSVDSVELCFHGTFLASATFLLSRFPTQTDAEDWLARYSRCTRPVCIRTSVV